MSDSAPILIPEAGAVPLAPDPLVGTTIDGRYVLESVLGEGGMGIVYRARHAVLNKAMAVKVLRPEVSNDARVIARFRQEAQSASAIGNQHIIDISDFGVLPDGATYFVMEFLDGKPLARVIEHEAPLPVGRLLHVVRQLCDALHAAHRAGIVHRDLKPDNIFLVRRRNEEDFVKVLDFGIAKVGGSASKLTQAGQLVGTPYYMSPEQCLGEAVDQRADIYAIGIILFELLTGRLPFEAATVVGLLTAHVNEPVPPPSSLRPECPASLDAVVLRCLAKRPDQRYSSCAELGADLEAIASGRESFQPVRISGVVASKSMPAPGSVPPQSIRPESFGSKSIVALGLAFGVVGLGGLGVGAYAVLGDRGPAAQLSAAAVPMPPQLVAPANDRAGSPTAARTIRLLSDPAGAEVYADGELLGVTPFDCPRPGEGQRQQLSLRLPGHVEKTVTISSGTLADELHFELAPVVRSHSSSHTPTGALPPGTASATTAAPAADSANGEARPRRRTSDVINPWAN